MDYLTTLHPIKDLGRGAFGIVRECTHDVHKNVAAKFFFRSNFSDMNEWQRACERALSEGQALRILEHRNVVRIHDVVRSPSEDELLVVMELCEKGSAGNIAAQNKINLIDIKKICRDAAIGLNYIHNKGYLHRDIKPDNILLTSNNDAKVGDFGFVTDEITLGFAKPYGTPIYLAPEVLEIGCCTTLTDVYSLGVTFLHLTHGDIWLERTGNGQLFKENDIGYPYLTNGGLFLPHLPTAWRTCINRLTRADPDKRCQSMDEAVNLISRLPAVEDWTCVVEDNNVSWSLVNGKRIVKVQWDDYLSTQESWRAWSEDLSGGKIKTLAKSDISDTWKQSYKKLQTFFASRKP
ncbi:serine/threonine-protein kinase [Azospirillum sp.]|uniref:serine/threonine-protein kinase n=1 Tax=Azospirillum sp. TaxID=34012 RepID=UPI002610D060|nr:serine/threonine-protein kinase [Azospirillum sp.]